MKRIFSRSAPAIFSALGTAVVLWKMLVPGYVLTLDLVFGPHPTFPAHTGLSAVSFPSSFILYLLQLILSGWVAEKIMLFAVFFLLFWLPLKFYPFENKYGERYFASVLFAINPFVYERLLAGQWKVILGYAFLFPFASCLIRLHRERSWHRVLYVYGWLLVIGMTSLHLLVMGSLILLIYFICILFPDPSLPGTRSAWPLVRKLIAGGLLLLLVSSYWIVPYFLARNNSRLAAFSTADWQAFVTAGDTHLGVIGNVAALYGFWGEHEVWVQQFVLPKTNFLLWITLLVFLAGIMAVGKIEAWRDKDKRRMVIFLSAIWLMAFTFSVGVGDKFFGSINWWLFYHIWFWKGFRDTEKWSAILALVYAMLGGLGVGYIANKVKRQSGKFAVIAGLCLIAALYTYTMAFGFNGQLKPVEYPASWAMLNDFLKQDPGCKALFLPWHEYYSLAFNNDILTANLASQYFHCQILTGQAPELGDISDDAGTTPEYDQLQAVVLSNTMAPDDAIRFMESLGIKYIIYTSDVAYEDPYKYPFLASSLAQKTVAGQGIDMYTLR